MLSRLWRSLFPSASSSPAHAMASSAQTAFLTFAALCLLVYSFSRTSPSTGRSGHPYNASNPPKYVYKIVPHSSVNPRYAFPVPIPASHTFVLSELDAKDGYLHLSTALQLPRTLNRFFAADPRVVLLKMDYQRLSGWKVVKWEPTGSGELFPHLYAQLEGENVESFLELAKSDVEGEKSADEGPWDAALRKAKEEGWLEE